MKWIEVIETSKSRNYCYIALCSENPTYAFNTVAKLDWVEKIMGCKFDDGEHRFIKIDLKENEDWEYLEPDEYERNK